MQFSAEKLFRIACKEAYLKKSDVYEKYSKWCFESGYKPLGKQKFYGEMQRLGFVSKLDNYFFEKKMPYSKEVERVRIYADCYMNVCLLEDSEKFTSPVQMII